MDRQTLRALVPTALFLAVLIGVVLAVILFGPR